MLSLRAWLMKQLRTWNLVRVEAHCEVIVERLTQELCSQGWHVLMCLEPHFWSPQPSFGEEEGNWSADRVYRYRTSFKQNGGLRVAWEKTRWVLKYELHCKHPQRPSGWNWRKRWESWKRQTDKFETSVSESGGASMEWFTAFLEKPVMSESEFSWQRISMEGRASVKASTWSRRKWHPSPYWEYSAPSYCSGYIWVWLQDYVLPFIFPPLQDITEGILNQVCKNRVGESIKPKRHTGYKKPESVKPRRWWSANLYHVGGHCSSWTCNS